MLLCVNHLARDDAGRDADVVIDGRSLCEPCARPMIRVLRERMTDELADDSGQV
jgi:hypothetical protein